MSWKNKMKHVLQYKESCVIPKISNLAIISSKLWKHTRGTSDVITKQSRDWKIRQIHLIHQIWACKYTPLKLFIMCVLCKLIMLPVFLLVLQKDSLCLL